jgi:hypothetical protein
MDAEDHGAVTAEALVAPSAVGAPLPPAERRRPPWDGSPLRGRPFGLKGVRLVRQT